ncbi:hypothetical protein F5B19DRAFT_55867 [Rostrohypoxylon terebratum]|nr:hypothetical protein F5B19DRAFT_55867 [Rostrohypoxylon terebratum]
MGDYEAVITTTPLSPSAPAHPIHHTACRRASYRSRVFLAALLVLGLIAAFHHVRGAVFRGLGPQPDSLQTPWPEARPAGFPDGVPVDAAAVPQEAQGVDVDVDVDVDADVREQHSDGKVDDCVIQVVESVDQHESKSESESEVKVEVEVEPKPEKEEEQDEPRNDRSLFLDTFAPLSGWQKPRGFKIVAVVFYGRKQNVDILDCYLQENLISRGGYLDDVWFMVHTKKAEDIAWLNEFVKKNPLYKQKGLGSCGEEEATACVWDYLVDDNTLYIKMDDDILYIHHDAIPQLVHTRLAQPHPYAISAQLVNSPITSLQQYHYGAIHPFLPDPSPKPPYRACTTPWRPSHFPLYPSTAQLPANPLTITPPYTGHPWLLLTNSTQSTSLLKHTPVGHWSTYPANEPLLSTPGLTSWAVAAQQQYSLLYNLELNQMHVYHFGRPLTYDERDASDDGWHSYYAVDGHYHRHQHHHYVPAPAFPPGAGGANVDKGGNTYEGPGGEQLYDTQFERAGLGFVALWGRDVKLALPIVSASDGGDGDEEALTVATPLRLNRPFVIDTRAVVSHLSFRAQAAGVADTDLVDRFRAFANDGVCLAGSMKKGWDKTCRDV